MTTPLEHGTSRCKEDHANGARNKNKQSRPRHWNMEEGEVKKNTPLEHGTRISKEDRANEAWNKNM
jgi:hypothetical protein